MADLRRDFIHAARQLLRSPGYTFTAIATLALGIGGCVAIFAAVDAMLLRPLPYPGADRLVIPKTVNLVSGDEYVSVSFGDYLDWNRETGTFDAVALMRQVPRDLAGGGRPERVEVMLTSPEFFKVLPIVPLHGRTLETADYVPGATQVAVISHQLWQQSFGGASDVVGRTVRMSGLPVSIVGILPSGVVWPENIQVFAPLLMHTYAEEERSRRDNLIFLSIARLREGVTIDQGSAVLAGIAARVERENESRKGRTNKLAPMRDELIQESVRRSLWILLGAVAGVLLIGCVNLANLGLVRGLSRSRELGVRAALGASRWRIVRQLLAESFLLSIVGATAGVAIAVLMMRGLVAMAPAGTPLVSQLSLDPRVLAGAIVMTMLALMLTGVVPAVAASRVDAGAALKDGTAGAGSSRRVRGLRHAMTVIEVACAVILLCGAALLLQSYWRLQRVDPGLDVDRLLSARVALPGAKYNLDEESATFFQSAIDRLEHMPGVESAAATSFVPIGGGGFGLGRRLVSEGYVGTAPDVDSRWNVITPGYFRTAGIPLLQGRDFTNDDRLKSEPVAIVSGVFARILFGNVNPIGKRIRPWRDPNDYRRIVGVVDDVRYNGLADVEPLGQVYVPHTQNSWNLMNIVVRARGGDPAALETPLRRVISDLDADLALAYVMSLRAVAGQSVANERYATLLLTMLATTALVMGALGIYGVVGHAVSMRSREFAVRSALGGTSSHLYRLVLGQGFRLTMVGLAIGLAGAFAVSRVIESLLYETAPRDPAVYIATSALVLAVALIASYGPARRAAKSDPLAVLRS